MTTRPRKDRPHARGACCICRSPQIEAINTDIISTGLSFPKLAKKYGFGVSTMWLHTRRCLPLQMAVADQKHGTALVDAVHAQLDGLQKSTLRILQQAEEHAKTHDRALRAISQARANCELAAKLQGMLGPSAVIQMSLKDNPEWRRVKSILMAVLADFPQARIRVERELAKLAQL